MTSDLETDPVIQARMSIDQLAPSERSAEQMRARFLAFAETECHGYAPFYEGLSEAVASDFKVLDIARQCNPGQPIPNLFFAAVHYLLLEEISHPLAQQFSSIEAKKALLRKSSPSTRHFALRGRIRLLKCCHSEECRQMLWGTVQRGEDSI